MLISAVPMANLPSRPGCHKNVRIPRRILLDPVYSGKAAAGLIDQITLGNFDNHEHVVFIHTGGVPALAPMILFGSRKA